MKYYFYGKKTNWSAVYFNARLSSLPKKKKKRKKERKKERKKKKLEK